MNGIPESQRVAAQELSQDSDVTFARVRETFSIRKLSFIHIS